jgi:hypothetical protein
MATLLAGEQGRRRINCIVAQLQLSRKSALFMLPENSPAMTTSNTTPSLCFWAASVSGSRVF